MLTGRKPSLERPGAAAPTLGGPQHISGAFSQLVKDMRPSLDRFVGLEAANGGKFEWGTGAEEKALHRHLRL